MWAKTFKFNGPFFFSCGRLFIPIVFLLPIIFELVLLLSVLFEVFVIDVVFFDDVDIDLDLEGCIRLLDAALVKAPGIFAYIFLRNTNKI